MVLKKGMSLTLTMISHIPYSPPAFVQRRVHAPPPPPHPASPTRLYNRTHRSVASPWGLVAPPPAPAACRCACLALAIDRINHHHSCINHAQGQPAACALRPVCDCVACAAPPFLHRRSCLLHVRSAAQPPAELMRRASRALPIRKVFWPYMHKTGLTQSQRGVTRQYGE